MPFGSSKAAILGASGGGGFGWEYSASYGVYEDWNSTGYTFVVLTSSGNLTFTGAGTIDMMVVGGGAGQDRGNSDDTWNGGGGGGGVLHVTGFEVVAETIAVTIGAKGTIGSGGGSSGTNGGQTELTVNGVNIACGGGGRGAMGGWGYCSTGTTAPAITAPPGGWGSIYRGSGGGGGGGGNWYGGYCGGGNGNGAAGAWGGTTASGTWYPSYSGQGTGNQGGSANTYNSSGGGGGGAGWGYKASDSNYGYAGTGTARGGEGVPQLNGWAEGGGTGTTGSMFGAGGSPSGLTNPSGNTNDYSSYGKGMRAPNQGGNYDAKPGCVLFRFLP